MSILHSDLEYLCNQNRVDPGFRKSRNRFLDKLNDDPEFKRYVNKRIAFGQARRRSKEKSVTLPKIAWIERPEA